MLVLVAMLFFSLSLLFTFKFIAPHVLKLMNNYIGFPTELNQLLIVFILFLDFMISLLIYSQLFLVFSGESEQVRYNMSYFVRSLYPPNIPKAIKLSLEYNPILFIFGITFQSIFYLVLYLTVFRKVSNKFLISLFFISLLVTFSNLPITIVENHDESLRLAKAEQEKIAVENVLDKNTQAYLEVKKGIDYPRKYSGCVYHYKALKSYSYSKSLRYTSDGYECKRTEDFCLFVDETFYKTYSVTEKYKKDLSENRASCYVQGWYGTSKEYSKDFGLEY
ncbi:hypothetical protein [Rivularia sp. UHCC 0363]|uniref:hypothetical protein n=1 Tax=Rivularia sp. UHCC 0363 TaxID=3110244 RepID=UPI002B1EF593|nr:hypothetical protein [Rivularia sp. UHCC 0363]MEA5599268.1 hypothetical protein [Rivularia sp. UHCC 0363]